MAEVVFIPREIRVGYQNRKDTYTGKLAYVIYKDDKGKVRKETSWNGWRDQKLDPLVTANEPTSGFVLNKKVGGLSYGYYDARQTYSRVYDPRGFEFEITIPNLLYVLENATSTKGKGLEGEFVYGWAGTELRLIPVEAPDYAAMISTRDVMYDSKPIAAKGLVPGVTYKNRKNELLIYLGQFQSYQQWGYASKDPSGKKHFFVQQRFREDYGQWKNGSYERHDAPIQTPYWDFWTTKSLTQIVSVADEGPHPDFAELMDLLAKQPIYSPHDESRDTFPLFTPDEFETLLNGSHSHRVYTNGKSVRVQNSYKRGSSRYDHSASKVWVIVPEGKYYDPWYPNSYNRLVPDPIEYETPEQLFEAVKPEHKDLYLANGQFYRREV